MVFSIYINQAKERWGEVVNNSTRGPLAFFFSPTGHFKIVHFSESDAGIQTRMKAGLSMPAMWEETEGSLEFSPAL